VRTEFGQVVRTLGDHGYFAYLPSAIPREIELDSRTVLPLSDADDALGRLAGVGRLLPNPHLLASAYLTQEAVASSRIEGTQASLSEVFRAVAGGGSPSSSDVQEVRNYIAALEHGLSRLQELPICLRLTREIHRTLMTNVRGREQHPGDFRTTQNWIGSSGDRPDTAAFVPPPVDHLAGCLADWERYANETPPVPVLVQCGLLHYQFETIHPFLDGNGRLGRLLIVLFLVSRARLPQPLLYISRFFEDNRAEYYDRLQGVRERGEIQEWLQLFLTAVAVQARDAVDRAEALVDLRERYRQALRGSRSRAPEVVDLLLGNPVLTAGRVERELAVTNAGALNLIRQLESLEVVQDVGRTGRGGRRVWVAHEVLTVLEGRSGDDQSTPDDHDVTMQEGAQ
jgi:Fic family protein